jgi:ATP-dependent DNA helicase RecG
MDLIRLLKQIATPLPFEEKKGYTNHSVKGGYAQYATSKIEQALQFERRQSIRKKLENMVFLLAQYRDKPSKEHYLLISNELNSLRSLLLQPGSIDECRVNLHKPLRYLKGMGPKREEYLKKLGLQSLWDLLMYFPKSYVDRSQIIPLAMAQNAEHQTFQGTVVSVLEQKSNRFKILKILVRDHTSSIQLVFFNQAYLKKQFENNIHQAIIISGRVTWQYNHKQMDNPEFEWLDTDNPSLIHTARIVPVYRLTAGINAKSFRSILFRLIQENQHLIYDFLPLEILDQLELPDKKSALMAMHFPATADQLEKSRQRLAFDEFLLGQYQLGKKKEVKKTSSARAYEITEEHFQQFESLLPYVLSDSQKKVIQELRQDLLQPLPMNRLIHGDVGSGKTTVAASALFFSWLNQYQSAFMAPTEILARQCYVNFIKLFKGLNISIALLVSDIKEKERRSILEELSSGDIDILVGTHAIIQQDVSFHSLGLIVVDEQHRFGVRQRLQLRNKGMMPHLLVMSATPIPRTLALTRYGDLDISLIDQMPMGKKKIKTKIITYQHLSKLYEFVKSKLETGGKAFVVCPLIEESEKMDLSSSIEKAEELSQEFESFSVLLLHGKMNAMEKAQIMADFASEKGHILVSTTVVEVGIDIPEANIMIVENAERFGLAQLHQLRGRIGRKSQDAYCFLLVKNKENVQRLQVLEDSDSGFVVAQKDLELRGPGELWGSNQSGYFMHSLIRLEQDGPLLEKAKDCAGVILQKATYRNEIDKELLFRGWPAYDDDLTSSG